MQTEIDILTERFDASLFVTIQNLGPHLISRAQLSLTPGQVFMLHFIRQVNQANHCTVSKLAEKMEVNPSAITVMMDRLENHEFIVRLRSQKDRRIVTVQLTELGNQALDQVLSVRKEVMQHCLKQLSAAELSSFVETLEKLSKISAAMDIKTIIESKVSLEEL